MTTTRFQERLLTELRHVVDERAALAAARTAPPTNPSHSQRRPARYVTAAAAAAGAVALAQLLLPDASISAYAVSVEDSGKVRVTINEMSDAAGLEAKLADAGIRADVTYLPEGTGCDPARLTDRTSARPDELAELQAGSGHQTVFLINPKALGSDDTLLIDATAGPGSDAHNVGALQISAVTGTLGPCVPVGMAALGGAVGTDGSVGNDSSGQRR